MMKSSADTAVPAAVLTVRRPDPVFGGTGAVTVVDVAAVGELEVILKRLGLFAGADASKLVPVMATEVPATPDVGVKLVIVGAPAAVTANAVSLVSDPFGLVTAIVPVVAPEGTVDDELRGRGGA